VPAAGPRGGAQRHPAPAAPPGAGSGRGAAAGRPGPHPRAGPSLPSARHQGVRARAAARPRPGPHVAGAAGRPRPLGRHRADRARPVALPRRGGAPADQLPSPRPVPRPQPGPPRPPAASAAPAPRPRAPRHARRRPRDSTPPPASTHRAPSPTPGPSISTRRTLLGGAAAGAATLGLAACGGGGGSAADAEITPRRIMAPLLSDTAPDPEGELQTAIEDFIGMPLEITWVPNSSYGDRVTVTMASDNIPHVMVQTGKSAEFAQTAEAGGFWDLTDIPSEYPNLTPENDEVAHGASINGRSYGIFRLRDPMRAAISIRKDWLDDLGLAEPETTDDLMEIARAFTEEDPAGDGSSTTGLIIPAWDGYGNNGPYDLWETWHGTANVWKDDGGSLTPAFLAPEFIEANRSMRQMVEAGHV